MANEFTIQSTIALSNGTLRIPKLGDTFNDSQVSKLIHSGVAIIAPGGTGVSLPLGDVTIPGWLHIKNLDLTNFAQWGPYVGATFYPLGRIYPNHEHQFMLDAGVVPSTTAFRLKADTAAVNIAYSLYSR